MTDVEIKTRNCNGCKGDFPENRFYRAGKYFQSHCIPCHNARRLTYKRTKPKPKPKKATGFSALDFDVRVKIIKQLANGEKLGVVARENNIPYPTLSSWRKKGRITLNVDHIVKPRTSKKKLANTKDLPVD